MSIFSGANNPGVIFQNFTTSEIIALQALGDLGDPNADRIIFWDDSAGTYAYLTPGTGLAITGTTLNATGMAIADADYGDITVSSSGTVWTIDNSTVTLAKMANVATATVFYRKTAGTGAPEVQTLATLKTDLGLTGTNSGDQTSIVGITGTKAQFNTAATDGDFLFVGDITQYTDEMAQDAIGAMVDASIVYVDATPLLTRAALTGDITASQGSNATTLATVNSNVGSFTYANITVNAKGLITAASSGTAPVTSVSGTTNRITITGTTTPSVDIAATYVGQSSITTLGTIGTGVWNGTTIAIANGGTGQTAKAAAFDALSPMTTSGDIVYGGVSGTGTRLAKATDGWVLTLVSGLPAWAAVTAGGNTFLDNVFRVQDDGDATKQIAFQASGITTGTTRTLTVQDASGTIALTSNKLSAFAATTSSELAGVISDETGSGALVFATAPGFTTAANPISNDGAALGTTALQWSDLFLASGAVVNFNNGDVTITHAADLLTVAGGNLALSDAASKITMGAQGTGSTATPTLLDMGGSFADTITSTKAKWKLYNDGTALNTYGIGITTGRFNFFTATAAKYAFIFNDTDEVFLDTAAFYPAVNDGNALGTSSLMWSDLFLATGAVINFNNGNVTLTHSAGILTLGGTATLALGTNSITMSGNIGVTGTRVTKGWFTDLEITNTPTVGGVSMVTASTTNTFTNKRVTKRTGTTASSGTPTINTDSVDFYSITALAAAITSFTTNLTGTPTEAQTLWIAITDNGTARAITWGTSFEASTVALPTTTVISTRLDVGFVWNTVTSKWRCVAVA